MSDDPLHPVKQKLDEIHEDVKGGFQTVHDRMDRETKDRAWSLERLWQALGSLREDIRSLFRRSP